MSTTNDWLKPGAPWSDIGGEIEAHRAKLELDDGYRQYLEDVRTVVRTPAGARVFCTLLEMLGAFDPSWSEKNARLAQKVVLRDFGQLLLDDLAVAADDVHDDIQRMMRIRRKAAESLATITDDKE